MNPLGRDQHVRGATTMKKNRLEKKKTDENRPPHRKNEAPQGRRGTKRIRPRCAYCTIFEHTIDDCKNRRSQQKPAP